jgi:hypothetical protein
MAKRPKIYYPKWQITTGLVAGPKQWMLRDTKTEYTGPFHRYVDGTVMTLGSYSESNSEYLVPYVDIQSQPGKTVYDEVRNNEDVTKYTAPKTYYPLKNLTLDDFQQSWFERYFVKRRNVPNGSIVEIDKKQYDTLGKNGSGINGKLYYGLKLRWKINGNTENVVENGVTIYSIQETNRRTLFFNEQKMPGITKFLGDLQEFSIYNKLTDSFIREELL